MFLLKQTSKPKQYFLSVLAIALVALVGYAIKDQTGYRVVAYMLLVTVSVLAILFDIIPVLLSALLSALVWDFFFIPPTFTFSVGNTEDRLMLLMYFIVAMINGVLTYQIRQIEKGNRKREENERSVKFYNTLLNSLSHELRTPITTIIGATDNLQTENERLSEDNKRVLLNDISQAGMRLNQQVENLLNMSRIESGIVQPKKDWCDINELMYAVISRAAGHLSHHQVNINIPNSLPLFQLDLVWMEQVLFNLVTNAAIYTPEGSIISINASCKDEKLVITVSDNGKGFPEEEIGKVFDKFYRLQNSKAGGTGLGLSIAKGFVEAHDGIITVDNMQLGGARFTIVIPAKTSYVNSLKNE